MKKSYRKWIIYLIIGLVICWLWHCTDVFKLLKKESCNSSRSAAHLLKRVVGHRRALARTRTPRRLNCSDAR